MLFVFLTNFIMNSKLKCITKYNKNTTLHSTFDKPCIQFLTIYKAKNI